MTTIGKLLTSLVLLSAVSFQARAEQSKVESQQQKAEDILKDICDMNPKPDDNVSQNDVKPKFVRVTATNERGDQVTVLEPCEKLFKKILPNIERQNNL